jgi:hypothetical protein
MTSTTNQIHISELRKLLSPLTLEELFQMFNEHTAILSFMRQTDGTLEFSVLDLEGCRQEIELKFQRLENSPIVDILTRRTMYHTWTPLPVEVLTRVGGLFKEQMDEINTIIFDYLNKSNQLNKSKQTNRILTGYYDPSEQQFFPCIPDELIAVVNEFTSQQDNFDYFEDGRPNESPIYKFVYGYDGKVTLIRHNDKEQFSFRTAEEFTIVLEKFKP